MPEIMDSIDERDTCASCGDDGFHEDDLAICTICEIVVCDNCLSLTRSDDTYCNDCYCLR